MTRPLASILALTLLLAAACGDDDAAPTAADPSATAGGEAASPTTATASRPVATGPANNDGARALEHVKKLAGDIGPRVSGTAGEDTATAYIAEQFRSAGYDVELMPFTFTAEQFQDATVAVGATQIAGLTMAGSRSGPVSGVAVFVGLADAPGIAGRSLAGKVAVADRGTLRFADKYDAVRAAGAIGLVIINNQPGGFSGTLGKDASFPVIAVAQEDGAVLREAATNGTAVGIEAKAPEERNSVDVIARPAAGAICQVLVGGHHDTVPDAPGANDNASGAASVIELARAFAADGLDDGLCFVTFGGEEWGLFGSKALAQQLEAANSLPRVMVNLDVTGIGSEVEVIGSADLKARALSIALRLSIAAIPSNLPANAGSDHQSFSAVGVPVVFFTSGDFATIHSPRDVVADISAEELDRVGDLAYALIADLLADE